ncbi:MAG: glycoside hydrolase family 3 protein, partial [Gelidibacter sp.]
MKNFLIIMISSSLLTVLVSFGEANANSSDQNTVFTKEVDSIALKVNALLAKMTLEEKIGQMNQYNGFWDVTGPAPAHGDAANKYEHLKKGWVGSMLNVRGVKEVRQVQKIAVEETRLGIPLIIGFDVIHGYKTISPIPLAEAASWDLEAIKLSARVAAEEASASGINWTFAPMVDISRDARWGRVMEGAGEDPYLASLIAKARVEGFQGDDLSLANTIAACAKHFVGYGFAEAGRDYNTVDVGTSTLYNVLLPPFKAAQDAGVRTFMNAFNELNGIPATGSAFLQRDILKGD